MAEQAEDGHWIVRTKQSAEGDLPPDGELYHGHPEKLPNDTLVFHQVGGETITIAKGEWTHLRSLTKGETHRVITIMAENACGLSSVVPVRRAGKLDFDCRPK
jgi:hypothetical protein